MSLKHKIGLLSSAVVLAGLLLLILFGDKGLADLISQRQERDNLVQRNEQMTRENLSLYRTIDRLKNDPTFIEEVARQELGMVGKTEMIIKFQSEKGSADDR